MGHAHVKITVQLPLINFNSIGLRTTDASAEFATLSWQFESELCRNLKRTSVGKWEH